MNFKRAIPTGVLTSLLAISSAAAGTVITLDTVTFGNASLSGDATVYLDADRIRIDSTEGGGDVTVIYSAKADEANPFYWLIDNASSTYVEIRQDELAAAAKAMEEQMDLARVEIDKAPENRRKELERMYAEQIGYIGFLATDTRYEEVSRGTKVGDWRCAHYQGFRDGEKVEEVWAATLGELGIRETDLEGLERLSGLFRTVGQNLPAFFRFGADDTEVGDRFPGFPIVVVTYRDGRRAEKTTIHSVESARLDPALFALPEGLQRGASPIGP